MSGCIQISFKRIGKPIELSFERTDKPLETSFKRIGKPVELSFERTDKPLEASFKRIGKPVEVSFSRVCSVSRNFYLRVSPGVVWLNEDNNWQAVISVTANVKWIIE